MKIVVFPDIILDLLNGDPFVLDVFRFHQMMGLEFVSCDVLEEDVKVARQPPSSDDWEKQVARIRPDLAEIVLIEREKYLSQGNRAEESSNNEAIEPYMAAYFFSRADAIWTNQTSGISGARIRHLFIESGGSGNFRVRFRNVDPDEVYFKGTWVPVANQPPPPVLDVHKAEGKVYRYVDIVDIPNMRFTREDAGEYLGRAGVYSYRRDNVSHGDFDDEDEAGDDQRKMEEAEDEDEKGDDDDKDFLEN